MKNDFYRELIDSLDSNCKKMKDTIDASTTKMTQIFKINKDERYINSQL